MVPKNILITGTSRGLGLELVRQLVALRPAPELVIAGCRRPESAQALKEIAKSNSSVKITRLDVEDEDSIAEAFKLTESLVGANGLNLIINNAGINYQRLSLNDVTSDEMMRTYRVNVVGPTLVCKTFMPLLKAAAVTTGASQERMSWNQAAVINVSSIMSSLSETKIHVMLQYRASKTALNSVSKSIGIEHSQFGVLVTCIHPGWVRTDMGGSSADVGIEESVNGMIGVFQTFNNTSMGLLYDYTGRIIPF